MVLLDRLEVVILEVVGNLLAEHGSLHVGGPEVDACPDAGVDHLLERIREPVEASRRASLLLCALKAILSVPKKFWSVCTYALVAQACPEGCSGKGGVASVGILQTGVAGSNSGSQVGSPTVL